MVIDLIKNLANQVLRERFSRWTGLGDDSNTRALMAAAGMESIALLREVIELRESQKTSLTYLDIVSLGMNPARLRKAKIAPENPYKTDSGYGLCDPLQLAAFFAVFGMREEAQLLLADRAGLIGSFAEWTKKGRPEYFTSEIMGAVGWGKFFPGRSMYRTWVPPDFEELRLPRVEMHDTLDSFYLEGAFEAKGYMARLKTGITPQNIEAFAMISGLKNRKLHDAMRSAAYEQARKLCLGDKGGGFRYADMTTYIRLCRPEDAFKIFKDLSGARQMIALVRHDAPEEAYIRGLRQLAQAEMVTRQEILERLGRGPTVEEVKKLRSIGIVYILDEMDWSHLQPIANEKGLRAAALPFAEKLGPVTLRRFLSDHTARVKRLPNIETEAAAAGHTMRITDASSIADWETVMHRLHTLWDSSLAVRRALRLATNDDAVSFLALLEPFKVTSPDIQKALQAHPNWRKIQSALEGYKPPDVSELWK